MVSSSGSFGDATPARIGIGCKIRVTGAPALINGSISGVVDSFGVHVQHGTLSDISPYSTIRPQLHGQLALYMEPIGHSNNLFFISKSSPSMQ
jgi:hypothetical protein